MKGFLEALVLILTAMTLGAGVIGLGIKYALLPWLETHLILPAQAAAENAAETRRQVTVNNHVSDPPTLLDTVHRVKDDLAEARNAFRLAGLMFEGHIVASEEDRAALWDAVSGLEAVTVSLADSVAALAPESDPS